MNEIAVVVGLIGIAVGALVVWLVARGRIASAVQEGRAAIQGEYAASCERVRSLEEEREARLSTFNELKNQAEDWRNALDLARDERAQIGERANRVPQLENQLANALEQQRNDQAERLRLSVSEAEKGQQLEASVSRLRQVEHELAESTATTARLSAELHASNEQRAALEQKVIRLAEVESDLVEHRSALTETQQVVANLRESQGRLSAELSAEKQTAHVIREELAVERTNKEVAERAASQLKADLAEVRANLESERVKVGEQMGLLGEAKTELSNQFKSLANDILEEKSKRFSEQNVLSIGQLVTPLKERMTEFKAKVEEIHAKDLEQQATLRAELGQLKELNKLITEEAHGLAVALKGQAKMQGNWGELVLGNVLDRAGLCEGKDYRREVSFDTEDGRKRPDVVLSLPQNKHLVIDAKVSLNAYTRYVNADDGPTRELALREHVAAIASRIQELSSKSYFDLPGLNTPEMVFMFIPIESAFVEALRADESLFQRAIEQNILVATPTTLLTSLNIVRQLWRFEEQNAHTAELAERAGKVYKKLVSFLSSMEQVGKQLDKAKDSYTQAFGQLYSGKGNLIQQARDFERLGVSVQNQLPPHIVTKAALELDHVPVGDIASMGSQLND